MQGINKSTLGTGPLSGGKQTKVGPSDIAEKTASVAGGLFRSDGLSSTKPSLPSSVTSLPSDVVRPEHRILQAIDCVLNACPELMQGVLQDDFQDMQKMLFFCKSFTLVNTEIPVESSDTSHSVATITAQLAMMASREYEKHSDRMYHMSTYSSSLLGLTPEKSPLGVLALSSEIIMQKTKEFEESPTMVVVDKETGESKVVDHPVWKETEESKKWKAVLEEIFLSLPVTTPQETVSNTSSDVENPTKTVGVKQEDPLSSLGKTKRKREEDLQPQTHLHAKRKESSSTENIEKGQVAKRQREEVDARADDFAAEHKKGRN